METATDKLLTELNKAKRIEKKLKSNIDPQRWCDDINLCLWRGRIVAYERALELLEDYTEPTKIHDMADYYVITQKTKEDKLVRLTRVYINSPYNPREKNWHLTTEKTEKKED